jgi:hypothetical protein
VDSGEVYVALSDGTRFAGSGQMWSNGFCGGRYICKVGDVNGDGRDDVLAFAQTTHGGDDSDVYVALSTGTGFGPRQKWSDYFCTLQEICAVGDVNGDGRDDVVAFVRTNNAFNDSDVWVGLSTGTAFSAPQKWQDYFCTLEEICAVGDMNADGRADLVTFVRSSGTANDSDVYVALSTGTSFSPSQKWHDYFCTLQEICAVGDVNGDGTSDVVAFVRTNFGGNDSDVWVSLSTGTTLTPAQKWQDYFCTLEEICAVGDVDGDGKADGVTFVRNSGRPNADDIYVTLSTGVIFRPVQKWHETFCVLQESCALGDFNGDGRDDAVAFVRVRSLNSDDVYVALSNGSQFLGTGVPWSGFFCTGQQICKLGDVNGDGRDDAVAFARTTHGSDDSDVYVALSNGSQFGARQRWQDYFCTLEEICAVGDMNGDGFDDLVAFVRTNGGVNDSDVYVALSTGGSFGPPQKWHDYFCTLQEICAVGDVNGDGRDDVVAFVRTNGGGNDSDVWVALSTGSGLGTGQKWQDYFCTLEEICAVGDVDGDGKADVVAFVRTNNAPNDSDVWVALSTGTAFGGGQKWHDYLCTLQEVCDLGDVNGDGRDDAVAFVRTNNSVGDSDVWVALSTGTAFGGGQKWHDYFCTLAEICALGDVNADGLDDAVTFVRARGDNPVTARTVDFTVSLYRTAPPGPIRDQYTAIFEHTADAVFEMTNGANSVGTITVQQNGQFSNTAEVVWVAAAWPNATETSGWGQAGERITMADTFTFPTPYNAMATANARGAGYTLAHEFGHLRYGLFDEYVGTATCNDPNSTFDPQTCDALMLNSVMGSQWNAINLNDLDWLNFSVAHNQNKRNVNWRAYGATSWEILARAPSLDPRDGQRTTLPVRVAYPELAAVAPAADGDPSIELPNSEARRSLRIIWVDPPPLSAAAEGAAGGYQAIVRSLTGPAILYPEPALLVATLNRDGEFIAQADVSAQVERPDGSTAALVFRDDGIAPDVSADDGEYSALMPYAAPGLHQVSVTFTNASGQAEWTYRRRHYTPGPNGETYDPSPTPVGEAFSQTAAVDLTISGFVAGSEGQVEPIPVTADNSNYPGLIDSAGDVDSFTFTAGAGGPLVVRVTDLALGMQPRIRLYRGAPPALAGEFAPNLQGDAYFLTRIEAGAGENFLVEVEDQDPAASGGLFNLSVGPALADPNEAGSRLYLPFVMR